MTSTSKLENLTYWLQRHRYLVILAWLGIAVFIGAVYSPNFLGATSSDFSPPEGTDAANANELLETYFPEQVDLLSHLIVVQNPEGSVLNQDFAIFTQGIATDLNREFKNLLSSIAGYYLFLGTALDAYALNFVSEDETTSFISITFDGDFEVQKELVQGLRGLLEEYSIKNMNIYLTGSAELSVDTEESIERDLSRIDSIVIPIVFIILLFLLRNYRYFPLTVIPILLTIVISFGLLERFIALTGVSIQSFVPSVLISLTLGIGVDYNLFLLSRFREERKRGQSTFDATRIMMKYAGHTVFTSGLTLAIALIGLIFFPINILSSIGIAISVAIFMLLLLNLTLTPALLLMFGNRIEPYVEEKEDSIEDNSEKEEQSKKSQIQSPKHGIWYKVGKFATKRKYAILIVILMITLPLSLQVLQSTPESQIQFFAPRNSDTLKGFELMQESFGPGILAPMKLIIANEDGSMFNEDLYNTIQNFITISIEKTQLESLDLSSYVWLGGAAIDFQFAINAIDSNSPLYNLPEAQLYRQFSTQYLNSELSASFIDILLPIDAYGPEAKELLDELKGIAQDLFTDKFEFGFAGLTADNGDIISETFKLFPLMILVVIVGIYIFIGFMFGAAILPARLIATIGLTLSFIYGAATVLFEYNTFLNTLFPILDEVNVTFWMVPVMSFSIILGLGIDYDVFTIERIRENVWKGMETKEAIAEGLDKTGGVITGAGIIMMIAFGGMIFSNSYILIQFGFVLAFGVFLDTFLVRTLLVPAIMSFAEKWNWWPTLPEHLKLSKTKLESSEKDRSREVVSD